MDSPFPSDFQNWILSSIPLLKAMEVHFDHYQPGELLISCPLAPNVNDKGTAFGGSIGTLATICGWTYTMLEARRSEPEVEALVAEHSMKFLSPARGKLTAVCQSAVPDSFHNRLARGRSGRLELDVAIRSEEVTVATFSGVYVARKRTVN